MYLFELVLSGYMPMSGLHCGSAGKESACSAGDLASIPGEGKGVPLQYSVLENSMDCIVYGVTKSQTFTCPTEGLLSHMVILFLVF